MQRDSQVRLDRCGSTFVAWHLQQNLSTSQSGCSKAAVLTTRLRPNPVVELGLDNIFKGRRGERRLTVVEWTSQYWSRKPNNTYYESV